MEPDHLAQLSHRYAKHSHGLPGLSLSLGGATMFLFLLAPPFLINHAEASQGNGFSLLALTVATLLSGWVLCKEWLRDRIYQSMGLAQIAEIPHGPALTRALSAVLALLALSYPMRALAAVPQPNVTPTPYQVWIGLAACLALPWITLRFIRGIQESLLWALLAWSALEFIWGMPDLNAAAPHSDGIAVFFILSATFAFFGGLAIGLVQHVNFLRLAREIRSQETPDE